MLKHCRPDNLARGHLSLLHRYNRKNGGLRCVYNPKKGAFITEVAQKGVLGAYLFIIFTFTCQHDQLVGVCSGRLKKGDLRCGSNSKKGGGVGLRCGSGKKGGLYRGTYLH